MALKFLEDDEIEWALSRIKNWRDCLKESGEEVKYIDQTISRIRNRTHTKEDLEWFIMCLHQDLVD